MVTSFPLGILTLFPGQSRTLDCTASGQPPPTITWTRNGLPVPSASLPSLSLADNGSLVLSEVTGTEEGNYSCVATNQRGTSTAPFLLLIEEGLITGSAQEESVSVFSGSSVCLDCGVGESAVLWMLEGKVVRESELVRVGGNGSLLISAAHSTYAGHYMCLTPGNRGWRHHSLHLHIKPKEGTTQHVCNVHNSDVGCTPEPPYFTVEPEDVHVVKKGFVLLACSADSSTGEHIHIHWQQADSNVSRTGPRHLVLQDNTLVLTNVRLQEAGQYSCVATNSYGRSISTAMVTVSSESTFTCTCSCMHVCTCVGLKVDQFVYGEEGSTLVLTCGLEAEEGAELEWLRDNHTPLASHNGEVWLRDVSPTHQGDYTCSYGGRSLNYFLIVQGMGNSMCCSGLDNLTLTAAPRITTPPSIVTASSGDTVTLPCAATGRPHPSFRWYREGVELERGDVYGVLSSGGLVVYEVEGERDAGVYLCKALNNAGQDEIRILLFTFK